MKLYEILRDFEESITKTGLPEPPKLSELLRQRAVGEVGKLNSYPDGMTIDEDTVPGWYNIGGKEIYISNFDIPAKTIYAGDKRNTIDLTPAAPKWKVAEPFTLPVEIPKTVYSGHTEVKRVGKPIKYTDTITPANNIERR